MSDEKFEEFLQREVPAYNTPPTDVPRDEMWDAIVSVRAAGAHQSRAAGASRRYPGSYVAAGLAAALVLGVAIGKFAWPSSESEAAAPAPATSRVATVADSAPGADRGGDASYALATTQHLSRAEALLTAYSATQADAALDAQLTRWAREMLSGTRLLLDSPAGRDPVRRRLLEDLELVLVQMAQRAPSPGDRTERAHIDRSLDRTQMLPRLRSTLPVGPNSGS
jgi:hypothetical protein